MFNFFALSRELRDLIYKEALVPTKQIYNNCGIAVYVHAFEAKKLFIISRQFRKEYREISARHTALTFVDVQRDNLQRQGEEILSAVPQTLSSARTVNFELWFTCGEAIHAQGECDAIDDLETHVEWIDQLLYGILSPRISNVTFYVYENGPGDVCEKSMQTVLHTIMKSASLRTFVIATADSQELGGLPKSARVVREWDGKTDVLHRVDRERGDLGFGAVEKNDKGKGEAETEDEGDSDDVE